MSKNRALLDAIRGGDVPGVLRCLDDGASIAWRDGKGCGALFHAVFQRQWAVVDTLLARGADIDLPEHRGWWWCLPFTCGSGPCAVQSKVTTFCVVVLATRVLTDE